MSKNDIVLKIILLGETSVGKTSLLLTYTDNYFPTSHVATIGVELKEKKIKWKNYQVTLQIWDTAGQERYHSITKTFFKGANGILFVYDITNRQSFECIGKWIKESKAVNPDYKSVLLGNKCDLNNRAVSAEELKNSGDKKGIPVFETSAKNDINVTEAFEKLIDLILTGRSHQSIIDNFGNKNNITLNNNNNLGNEKKKCCI